MIDDYDFVVAMATSFAARSDCQVCIYRMNGGYIYCPMGQLPRLRKLYPDTELTFMVIVG